MGPFSIRDVKRNKTLELRRKHRHRGWRGICYLIGLNSVRKFVHEMETWY